ncbi:conserved hypothetical protein. Putative dynein light chain protein [Geotrichum candidum]|uniref:Topoisomerase I damage affected protein 2 n=1 Tax=Geotrichum candidum TaxID=1173061 RepID=A0A0J9YHP4_GEOCN|nr:conserved hypothetical protein. Putative dynein light chain protein [Geotrichum candidum]
MSIITDTRVSENTKIASTSPIPVLTLGKICDEVCTDVFDNVRNYDHEKSTAWNNEIIQLVLKGIEKESSAQNYKYIVYVTTIERVSDAPSESDSPSRGIRTSSGGFWNPEKDGMWNHKWTTSGTNIDVVFSIAWIHSTNP